MKRVILLDNTHPHVACTVQEGVLHTITWKGLDIPQAAWTFQLVTSMCVC